MTVYVPGEIPGSVVPITGDATICAKSGVVDAGLFFCLDRNSGRDGKGNYVQYLRFFGDPLAHNR